MGLTINSLYLVKLGAVELSTDGVEFLEQSAAVGQPRRREPEVVKTKTAIC